MHPALHIDEILVSIFCHFICYDDEWSLDFSESKTLASAARCCKTFSEPALNQLWETQISLFPLLSVLPSFQPGDDGIYHIVTPVKPPARSCFERYAQRIRRLTISPDNRLPESPHTLISRIKGNTGLLLPKLSHMRWTQANAFGEANVLFVSPALRTIEIGLLDNAASGDNLGISDRIDGLPVFIESLAVTSTGLETLKIDGILSLGSMLAIARFQELRVLNLSASNAWTDLGAYCGISALPHLSRLYINTTGLELPVEKPALSQSSFRSLQILDITGSPSSIGGVLHSMSFTKVKVHSIAIKCLHSFDPPEWAICLRNLHPRLAVTVRNFEMNILWGPRSRAHSRDEFMTVFGPLVSMHRLETVSVKYEGRLQVLDTDVHSMASAWPHLQIFHFWYFKLDVAPTLRALISLAACCPQLTCIELAMNATVSNANSGIDLASAAPLRSLERLVFLGNIAMDDPDIVVAYIRHLFPSIKYLDGHTWGRNDMWDKVKAVIPSLTPSDSKPWRRRWL